MDIFKKQRSYKIEIGQRLMQARMRIGFSQEALAEAIGTTSRSISRWEHGNAIPQQYYWERLSKTLCISPEKLFSEKIQKQAFDEYSTPIWYVPYTRNSCFTGREEILNLLHERFHARPQAAWTQPHILSGLGGIGKTQIALEYAYQFGSDYQAVLWIRAEAYETFQRDCLALVELFQIPQTDNSDSFLKKEAIKHWFHSHSDWLLIFDGLKDLKMLDSLLPKTDQGCILITTRSQITGSIGVPIDVREMNLTESALFLLKRSRLLPPDSPLEEASASLRTQAKRLGKLLDGLPLALDQAGAYIEESMCSIYDYLEHYTMHPGDLLNNRGITNGHHPDSVSRTLSLCFQQVDQVSPLAADLLRLCAFLPSNSISEKFLIQNGKRLGPVLQAISIDPLLLDEAIRQLRCFSLLYREVTARMLYIHPLLQVTIQYAMAEYERKQWTERVSELSSGTRRMDALL